MGVVKVYYYKLERISVIEKRRGHEEWEVA